jgi:hypothetical protein
MWLMKRLSALCGFLLLFTIPAAAQTPATDAPQAESKSQTESGSQSQAQEPTPPPPLPPVVVYPYEISAGYNLRVFTEPNYARVGLNGGYGSFEYKILSRLSAEGEISGGVRNQGNNGDLSIYTVVVGAQGYPFKHRRKLTPFVHLLLGEGFYRDSYPAYAGFPHQVTTDAAFTWEGGGGLDLTHSTHWSFRIQLDYAPTKFLGNQSQTNYRGSVGLVYRFGEN